jgi:hypothetical protein
MAHDNQPSKLPQARHGKKSSPSQHDKRNRLINRNAERRQTQVARVSLIGSIADWVQSMSASLHGRSRFRLAIVMSGAILATSRRTASRWFQAAGVADDWDRFYELLISVGKASASMMLPLVRLIVARFDPGPEGRWLLAIDDSPTKRYGRHVEAANVHHHPTPGPADGTWLYGHNWVCLAILVRHASWGVFALPVLSRLYVRREDVVKLKQKYTWEFHTKHALALQLVRQWIVCLRALGAQVKVMLAVDGAYAASPLLRPLVRDGVTVISRLRRDARLLDVPVVRRGQKGRPRIYGMNRISLVKRAGHRDGWATVTFSCRGTMVTRRFKTFLATTKLTGGLIRVVLLEHESKRWAAYFSTDVHMTVQEILEAGAARWAIEEFFHDVKETWGAGQQQVRNVWSNIGCWHLNSWLYTMVELACWDQSSDQLVDRSDRSWDNATRRPSHADRRRTIAREMLANQFLNDLPPDRNESKYRQRIMQLLNLAA